MLTVATVLKSGGIYTPEWVAKLKAGVERHLKLPHRFVCLSDVEVPCERIPLEHDWPKWWGKIELFKLDGPVLFSDLDNVPVDNLDEIGLQAEQWEFTAIRDFYRPSGLGSGLMAWGWGVRILYDVFSNEPARWMAECSGGGDQEFVEKNVNLGGVGRWQDRLPDQVVSYKVHCCRQDLSTGIMRPAEIPANARMICLHGKPKFRDMPTNDPVRLAWEAL